MQRELSSFPIPPVQRMKLQKAGFITVEDVIDIKPSELSRELGISKEESLDILKLVRNEESNNGEACGSTDKSKSTSVSNSNDRSMSALEMLQDEDCQQSIITFSERLDALLGGGVPLQKITEFCGAPGVGKTQICLQLCIDVQIPELFGGLGAEAVYIDTEGSFLVERLVDMANAAVKHCQRITDLEKNPEQLQAMESFSLESLLSGVHYFRCNDYVELLATVHLLPEFLQEHPQVKLIVVDSIAFHFRHDFEDLSLRTRLLNGMAQSFIKIATLNKLAVVLTNQMTTKIQADQPGGSHLVPALGESWGHASTVRVILYWEHNVRYALLYKSPSRKEATVPYQVTTGGVRDVERESATSHADVIGDEPLNPTKRQRLDT